MDKDDKIGEGIPFERIRRITGYLVGDYHNMNDAKQAEVKEGVKHNVKNTYNSDSMLHTDRNNNQMDR